MKFNPNHTTALLNHAATELRKLLFLKNDYKPDNKSKKWKHVEKLDENEIVEHVELIIVHQ